LAGVIIFRLGSKRMIEFLSVVVAATPLASIIMAGVWAHYALRAKRERRYYLASFRAIAALASFAVGDYAMWIIIRIATL
jgi:hypothetical protein